MIRTSLEIRVGDERQIGDVCHILREGYLPKLLRGTVYESPRFDHFLEDRFQLGDLFLLAGHRENSGDVAGFAQVIQTESALHLNHLVVRSAARGSGLGAVLLENVISRADAAKKKVTLDVDSRNEPAVRLYNKMGFRVENEMQAAMIGRKYGSIPLNWLDKNADYKRYGFCYIEQPFSWGSVKIGVVGLQTIRLVAANIPSEFDWKDFSAWAKWADVYAFGSVRILPRAEIQERWSILRMVH